ncbi:hypothetical protein [Pseudogemmobacter faecipullorum]|uniref:Uncharacterized protein n=1 Tax=Pseudogemmobacter faecipullorum TaxID=2755041 RepID=A0ABS8CTM4_9RHOB|nr:hypothetical protein [Pseudogemmobacter faecipullorum]MCB5412500.1 hypothetical protein [Pseudogemmobacter faecipullorum]
MDRITHTQKTGHSHTEKYFVSEAYIYRLLKSHDLITSPAYIVIKAADEFKDKTTAPSQRPGMVCRPQPVRHNVRRALRRLSI